MSTIYTEFLNGFPHGYPDGLRACHRFVPLPRPAFRLSSRLHLVIMNAGITIVGSQGPKGETHQS